MCCKLAVKVQGKRIDDTTGGNSGVEPRVAVMYTETVEKRGYSLEKFVDVVSANAARILGLYPRKGAIAVGSDADITVLDTSQRRTVRAQDLHESDYTPWEGKEVGAWPVLTMLRGKVMVADGRVPRRPQGRAVPQAPHPGRHPGSTQRERRQRSMTMKVSWFHRFGGPEVLVCEETGKPTPGAGEAVVRVRAVGINHVDLDHRAGTSRIPVTFPHILGREFAGEVAEIGGATPGGAAAR